jgi:UDP-2,3-diacylglucosamine hydrolase
MQEGYINISLHEGKKIYFASDFHLGTPNSSSSLEREKKIIRWLDQIKKDAQAIFLVGDVYDFWFEYKYLIPKGFIRFQAKLVALQELGIQFYFFPGNHDLWMFGYYQQELNAVVSREPIRFEINGKKFFVVHGDGRGPGDHMHKIILKVFESKFFQWLFKSLPPDFTYWIANSWSKSSRAANAEKNEERFLGEDEWLWQYAKKIEKSTHFDYYIFGHRHLPLELEVAEGSTYINLGDWLKFYTYGVFDGNHFELLKFEN